MPGFLPLTRSVTFEARVSDVISLGLPTVNGDSIDSMPLLWRLPVMMLQRYFTQCWAQGNCFILIAEVTYTMLIAKLSEPDTELE